MQALRYLYIKPGSRRWNDTWACLAHALAQHRLPRAGGGTVRCAVKDFMLMESDGRGRYFFKNRFTRHYLCVARDGSLAIPADDVCRRGLFADRRLSAVACSHLQRERRRSVDN